MTYHHIITATFLSRPNRFIAQVRLDDGTEETVHVKNTGRCRELLIPGCTVYLEKSDNPNRKTLYDLIAVEKHYDEISDWKNYPLAFQQRMKNGKEKSLLFNIDSQSPNKVVLEWLQTQGYSKIKPEYNFGKSRVDFYLEKFDVSTEKTEKILMEVKGCTLEVNGVGYFPDAPTERGVKHLKELTAAISEGYKAIQAFVIQMEGVEKVLPNTKTHPEFAFTLEEAQKAGVEVWFLPCKVEPEHLEIINCIKV